MAANATFALKPGVWFLRVRFVIFAPDSRREPSPPSGRKSTQPTVQILEASSLCDLLRFDNGLYLEIFVGTGFIRAASIPTWNIGQAVQVWLAPFRRACVGVARNLDQPGGSKGSAGA